VRSGGCGTAVKWYGVEWRGVAYCLSQPIWAAEERFELRSGPRGRDPAAI